VIPGINVTFLTQEGAEFLFHQNRQFLQGKTTDEVNILANEEREVYCEVQRLKRATTISCSTIDGILAAKNLDFKTCDRITTEGMMSILQTCDRREIEIKTTKCGPQIKYTDPTTNISYGIANNSYQFTPLSPCLIQHGLLSLNENFTLLQQVNSYNHNQM